MLVQSGHTLTLHFSHSTPHTPLLTLHFSHSTPHTPLLTLHSSHSTSHTPLLTLHSSHSTPHTPLLTLHSSHSTSHTPLLTLHSSHSTSHTPLLTLTANDTRWAGLVNLAICVDSLKISDAARRVRVGGGGREGRKGRRCLCVNAGEYALLDYTDWFLLAPYICRRS